MPMRMSENYPDDWFQIAFFIKEANAWCCQECGRQCTKPGEPYRGATYVLTVAHVDQEYLSPEIFVAALCSGCHLRHDAPHSAMFRRRLKRYRQRQAGQLAFGFGV